MSRNIMAYLQMVREIDPRAYGLGGIGGEASRLIDLSNDELADMNSDLYNAEVRGMLTTLSKLAKQENHTES